MTDLFISYNSHDEVWAKKLFLDLTTRFPAIKPFWARDNRGHTAGRAVSSDFSGSRSGRF